MARCSPLDDNLNVRSESKEFISADKLRLFVLKLDDAAEMSFNHLAVAVSMFVLGVILSLVTLGLNIFLVLMDLMQLEQERDDFKFLLQIYKKKETK